MTVAHDTTLEPATFTTVTPYEFTYTPVGTPRGVQVRIAHGTPSTDVITSVSYGGVAMTRVAIAQDTAGEPGAVYVYHLSEGLPPGAQTVSIVHTGSATVKWVDVVSQTGNRNTEIVVSGSLTADQSNPQVTLDTGARTAARYWITYSGQDAVASLTALGSQTALNDNDFGTFVVLTGRRTAVASGSIAVGYTAASEDVAMIGYAVAEVEAFTIEGAAVTVEAAFGYGPFDTPGWTDITDRVRELSFKRGRQHELDRFEAGTATFSIDNQDGALNPHNTTSVFYPNVKVNVPIRVRAEYSSVVYPLWYGYVESWPVMFPGNVDAVMEVEAVDLFKQLSLVDDSAGVQATEVMATTPEAYWRFTDAATEDISGNSHTLTFAGSPTTDVAGVWTSDEAVTFDGSNDEATVASEAVLEYVDVDMTIAGWVRPNGNTEEWVASSGSGAGSYSWGLYFGYGTFNYWAFVQGTTGVVLTSGVNGDWQHIAVTRTVNAGVSTIRIYRNGALFTTQVISEVAGAATRTVRIGRGDSTFGTVDISELAFWGRALSGAEIDTLSQAQREGGPEELTSTRISGILTRLGITDQDIHTGKSTMAAFDIDGSALDGIQAAETTESGQFFIAADGTATFHDRHYRLISQSSPLSVFDGTEYSTVEPSYDDNQLWNQIRVNPGEGTSSVSANDTASQTAYGTRTLSVTSYPADVNEASDQANWLLGLYREPSTRINAIRFRLGGLPALFATVLPAEVGNRYNLEVVLAGDDLDQDVYLEAMTHNIRADKTWDVGWQLSPAVSQSFWLLGVAGFGELDDTTYLGF